LVGRFVRSAPTRGTAGRWQDARPGQRRRCDAGSGRRVARGNHHTPGAVSERLCRL